MSFATLNQNNEIVVLRSTPWVTGRQAAPQRHELALIKNFEYGEIKQLTGKPTAHTAFKNLYCVGVSKHERNEFLLYAYKSSPATKGMVCSIVVKFDHKIVSMMATEAALFV